VSWGGIGSNRPDAITAAAPNRRPIKSSLSLDVPQYDPFLGTPSVRQPASVTPTSAAKVLSNLRRSAPPPQASNRKIIRMQIRPLSDCAAVGDVGLPDFRGPEVGLAR